MLPPIMHVLGLLLTLCVANSVGQSNNSSSSNNTDVTSPPTNNGTTPTAPQGKNPNFGFDCRRKANDCNGKPCNLETGTCTCSSGGQYSYNCADNSSDSTTCSPACDNGAPCHAGKCVCTENFYGSNCNLTRVQVLCKGEKMFVNINPIDNFSGNIYVPGNNTCNFSPNSSAEAEVDFTAELEKLPGLQGQRRVLQFTDAACGHATVTPTAQGTAYTFKIYVQYMQSFKSAVDQIVVAECLVTNGTVNVSSTDVSSVIDIDTNLKQVNADGKLDAVTLRVLSSDQKSLAKTVTLGDEIHLSFTMPVSNGSTFTDFRLQLCIANNTLTPGAGYTDLTFLKDGCPTPEARSIFAGLPKKTITGTNTTTDVVLRAFIFVGSSQLLGFTCVVGLCSKDKPGDCAQSSCSDEASTAPPANSSGVRKREAGNEPNVATIGANTVHVVGPGQQESDSASDNSEQVTSQTPAEPCSVYKFTIAVVILGVCVFLLLLLSACLIFQLMQSKKTYPERPDHYPRPVEGLRFPRMELNNAHDNGF